MPTRDVRILGTGQLLELNKRLRAAGGQRLQQNTARRIRRAAEPVRTELQRAIRTNPIRGAGGGSTRRRAGDDGRAHRVAGLRESIAHAIRLSVRTTGNPGARIWIDRGQLPADQRSLPDRIEDGRWRHPVFGNRSVWVNQYSRPWWAPTLRRMEPRMRAEVARVLDDVERRLGG
jgi:hypothetical protein